MRWWQHQCWMLGILLMATAGYYLLVISAFASIHDPSKEWGLFDTLSIMFDFSRDGWFVLSLCLAVVVGMALIVVALLQVGHGQDGGGRSHDSFDP
jgi:hypothetical protein